MNEVITQPQAGVYGSLNAQEMGIGELHIGNVESTISREVGIATGAAMLDAHSYVDPSVRGALYGQYAYEAQAAAAQSEAVRDAVNSVFEDEDEKVNA
jgi:hypothetical protein